MVLYQLELATDLNGISFSRKLYHLNGIQFLNLFLVLLIHKLYLIENKKSWPVKPAGEKTKFKQVRFFFLLRLRTPSFSYYLNSNKKKTFFADPLLYFLGNKDTILWVSGQVSFI